jgi:hypothetical protein
MLNRVLKPTFLTRTFNNIAKKEPSLTIFVVSALGGRLATQGGARLLSKALTQKHKNYQRTKKKRTHVENDRHDKCGCPTNSL